MQYFFIIIQLSIEVIKNIETILVCVNVWKSVCCLIVRFWVNSYKNLNSRDLTFVSIKIGIRYIQYFLTVTHNVEMTKMLEYAVIFIIIRYTWSNNWSYQPKKFIKYLIQNIFFYFILVKFSKKILNRHKI